MEEDIAYGPALEDLEPIDKDGEPIEVWRAFVNERMRVGQPLGAAAFQYLDQRSVLGQGSFGIVWRAQEFHSGQRFAVKNIRSPYVEGSAADREFQMSNHIRLRPHPCIVTLFHVLYFPNNCFYMIVMELCPQGDLLKLTHAMRKEALYRNARFQPHPACPGWVGQVFLGLEHLHLRVRAILRDLKPDNVVISESGHAKLTDFGLGHFGAEAVAGGTWSFGVPPGSPGYIAPETLLQESYDFRADLYSFGVLIWLLYTGGVTYDSTPRPPLGNKGDDADFFAHSKDWYYLQCCVNDPENNGALALPANLKELVLKLTQRRSADRPAHGAIRNYSFIEELDLPEVGDGRDQIMEWLAMYSVTPEELPSATPATSADGKTEEQPRPAA
jgi:serine/threonine protein kinase